MDKYIVSPLPGIKEGISGSALIGYNIGIDINIDPTKKMSAIKAVSIMTSREFQKREVLKGLIISGMTSLYDDEEVCSNIIGCDLYKEVQPIAKPINRTDNYIEYSRKFTHYFYDYLFGNKIETAESVLRKIDDITKIYYMTLDTNVGLIFFILFLITFILMILSLIFLFIKKYENVFTFLPKFDWIMIMIGIIAITASSFVYFGKLTNFKCHMKNVLFSLGYTFIYCPILHRMIINFPVINKYSLWINHHKKLFFSTLILFDIMLNGLSVLKPYGIKDIIIDEGYNFQICKMKSSFIIVMTTLLITYKCIMILVLLFIIFIEWNNEVTFFEIRFILTSIYMNIITFLLFIILNFVKINNYIYYFIIQESIIYIISISNYIILYGIKLFSLQLYRKHEEFIKKANISESFIEKAPSSYKYTTTTGIVKTRFSTTSSTPPNTKSIISKILYLHCSTSPN